MKISSLTRTALVAAVSATLALAVTAHAQQPRTLKIQSAVPASTTTQDALKFFAERVDKLTGGNLKIDALPGGAVVPPFEILDATHKKVIDGAYGISYWWVGKNNAATLFANTPAGIAGMDAIDFIGWVYDGGGLELWNEFYQKELKLNLVAFPSIPPSPQALGWFKRPIKDLPDFKGMKCRQTGIVSQLYAKMGMAVVDMPGGEGPAPRLAYGLEIPLHARHARERLGRRTGNQQGCLGQPAGPEQGSDQVGLIGDLPALVGDVSEDERGGHPGVYEQARREAPDDAAGGQHGVPENLGRVRGGGIREESVLQEGLRVPAGLCLKGGAGQALHVSALRIAGRPLLARENAMIWR
jgi:hypothetical protein